jgi:cell division GTPase FtsZ
MRNNSEDYIRTAIHIFGIGEYGLSAVSKLKQDIVFHVKYHTVEDNRHIENIAEFLHGADVVFIIADINSKFSLKKVNEIAGMSKEKSHKTIFILSDSCLKNDTDNSFMEISDMLFIIAKQISSDCMQADYEYKQIYSCAKALTDICGDRMGLLNTGFGDIISSIRKGEIGYIGFGEADGKNAVKEATDAAFQILAKYNKLQNANEVIATISYNNCSLENIRLFIISGG